jgi:hypothetical protein
MNTRNNQSHKSAGAFCAAAALLLSISALQGANPPAQGPPAAATNATGTPVDNMTPLLQAVVDEKVALENQTLSTDPSHRAVISAVVTAGTPYMSTTTHPNAPNQFDAEVPFTATYHVTNIQGKVLGAWISYPFDRYITQEILIQTTCEGWSDGSGAVTFTAIPLAPQLVGDHSFLEQVFGDLLLGVIPDYIDNQIRSALAGFALGSTTISNGLGCRTLGVATKAQGFESDTVTYDHPFVSHPVPVGNQITVTVTSVKRLQVLDNEGNPVYHAQELPEIDFYAGFTKLRLKVPLMSQGQTAMLTQNNTLQTQVPSTGRQLVIIANNSAGNDDINADYAFTTFGSSTNFGDGTHTLSTPKHWIQPLTQRGQRPVVATTIGYQITYEVSVPLIQNK